MALLLFVPFFRQCRALAAAIFGADDYQLEIRALDNSAIYEFLQNGTVDVIPTKPAPTMADDVYLVRSFCCCLLSWGAFLSFFSCRPFLLLLTPAG